MSPPWVVRLAERAQQDFADIVRWTHQHWGAVQAQRYADTLTLALEALVAGPDVAGVKARGDIAPGIHILHVARQGRKGRHFVVLRVAELGTIDVLRILHDSMDLPRHVGAANDEQGADG